MHVGRGGAWSVAEPGWAVSHSDGKASLSKQEPESAGAYVGPDPSTYCYHLFQRECEEMAHFVFFPTCIFFNAFSLNN